MDELYEKRLVARLEADVVLRNLSRVGVAVTLYELLKYQVVEQVKGFKGHGQSEFDNDGITHKSGFSECLDSLARTGAVSRVDVGAIEAVRSYRNQLAHESGSFIIDPDVEIRDEVIDAGAEALRNLSLFWVRVEIDANPAYDGMTIRDEDIGLPVVSLFRHVLDVSRGLA